MRNFDLSTYPQPLVQFFVYFVYLVPLVAPRKRRAGVAFRD